MLDGSDSLAVAILEKEVVLTLLDASFMFMCDTRRFAPLDVLRLALTALYPRLDRILEAVRNMFSLMRTNGGIQIARCVCL